VMWEFACYPILIIGILLSQEVSLIADTGNILLKTFSGFVISY
jgi:hypothetical protein